MRKSDMEKKERQSIYVITIHIFVFAMVFLNNTYLIFILNICLHSNIFTF